jgi:hypothetical protein
MSKNDGNHITVMIVRSVTNAEDVENFRVASQKEIFFFADIFRLPLGSM